MNELLVAKYLTALKNKNNLTYDAIAKMCDKSESTVKNLCLGKSDNPGIDTIAPVVYAMGGSLDEMLNPGKSKDELKEVSVVSLKESYEYQLSAMKETNEAHIGNIRAHYEQHHNDLKENYEKRLADKRELLDTYLLQIKKLENANKLKNILCCFLAGIFIVLFILEIMHPEHGWLRY